ncbi:hypothetical protein [Streptomyces sp. NPDC058572]|uniref:hypothetical protein n=1 Tax=Streptomyces sp. NPDC058572 TaxID=3346546 RepID=UPI003665B51A
MSARTAARASVSAALGAVTTLAVASAAYADEPETKCDLLRGPAREYCDEGDGAAKDVPGRELSELDPLAALADGFAKAAAWTVDQLSNAVKATGDVDFTNSSFLKTYALVFAASTFLTILLWLWAIIKRAVRGVPLTRAMGEAVGMLWLTVIASAFTPLVLYTVVSAVDSITDALAGGETGGKFFEAFSTALRKEDASDDGGGPIARIILALISILAAGVVWLELVVRTALLYVGAALGTVVYAGLVDRDLWGRVRRWVGIMVAVILVKPIIVIVLLLASALTSGEPTTKPTGAVVSGLAIIFIAVFASAMLFKMIPGMGDDIIAARRESYDPASKQGVALVTKPVAMMRQGISTHADRDALSRPTQSQPSQPTSSASSGMSAHASRPTRRPDLPRQDDRSGDGARR